MFKYKCAIIASLLAMLLLPSSVSAQPMTGGFQGTVIAGGNSLPDGTIISAWIDGEKVAETETENSEYSLFIHSDYTGETVTFKVGKFEAEQTGTWTRGETVVVNLSINSWPFQCEFYGQVNVDGQYVPDGTEISAWIDSAKVQTTTTVDSMYSLVVPGNYTGKAVAFKVDAHFATQIVEWQRGEALETNLVVSLGPLVCGFYGTVTLNGDAVPGGTDVSAWVDGLKVQNTNSGSGTYALNIPGDYTGKIISFKVAGQATKETSVWVRGGNRQSPLNAITTSPPGVTVGLSSLELEPGDEFTLTVTVDPNGHGISGGEIDLLSLDSDVIEVLLDEATFGTLLGSEPIEGKKEKSDTSNGENFEYAIARKGETPVPTSVGTFAVIKLRIKGGAEAGRYAIPNAIILTDENFKNLEFDPPTVSIKVVGNSLPGDLNGDESVGLADLAILASAYGTTTGASDFRADADLNSNSEVDLGDLAILAGNWGLQVDQV